MIIISKFKVYAKSIIFPVLGGLIIGLIISRFIDYNSLIKPPFSPPSIVFPIVWTILYILMGISYGILKFNALTDAETDFIYYLQLFFNYLWSIIFFVFKWRLFAFIWIVLLVLLVIFMTLKFYSKNKIAGLLQIPYIIWVLFATYLNLFVYLLNR